MSSTNQATANPSGSGSGHCAFSGCGGKGKWSPMNIAVMVLGFVIFWPVGLVVLFWILSGRHVRDLPGAIRDKWAQMKGNGKSYGTSDNVVFNEYQQTQFDRIREIKEEISTRAKRFSEFRADAKRRADDEEFQRFMASNPAGEK